VNCRSHCHNDSSLSFVKRPMTYSEVTREAAQLFGATVRLARQERR
jgi:hypothetical protein